MTTACLKFATTYTAYSPKSWVIGPVSALGVDCAHNLIYESRSLSTQKLCCKCPQLIELPSV